MLTLARVLVLEPKLLIADELSLGLAPIITTEIYRVLERILQSGTALLVVEQHIDHALALAEPGSGARARQGRDRRASQPRGDPGVRLRATGSVGGVRSRARRRHELDV